MGPLPGGPSLTFTLITLALWPPPWAATHQEQFYTMLGCYGYPIYRGFGLKINTFENYEIRWLLSSTALWNYQWESPVQLLAPSSRLPIVPLCVFLLPFLHCGHAFPSFLLFCLTVTFLFPPPISSAFLPTLFI